MLDACTSCLSGALSPLRGMLAPHTVAMGAGDAVRPHSAVGDLPPEEFEQLTLNRATAPILSS